MKPPITRNIQKEASGVYMLNHGAVFSTTFYGIDVVAISLK